MKRIIIMIVLAGFLYSCSSEPEMPKVSKQELNTEIQELKTKISSENNVNSEKAAMQIVNLYAKYVEAFPKDSNAIKYLFESAQVNVGLGLSPEAIANLDTIVARYPKSEVAPSALQFKAFILDDRMRRWQKASEVLDELIEKYPNSDIIENAKAYKQTLGKSPEQIIKEMEANNAASNK